MREIRFADLRRLLVESAGELDGVELTEDVIDEPFDSIGYDSLALMETAAAVSKEYGADIPDDSLGDVETPRQFLELANAALVAS
ncbi:acyl carrier protein [Actinomadura chibensis]|uniref:Acyl carrier protein n=1 Tax=Actinomadura chibensis TaxID=392828 RepID=A0A5D0NUW2_9ACTN|nr:acyl carrier protein [Actinomadura chibensis]TYB47978.1 acyl carrier protein [Actinomadura chibensis]